MSRLTIVVAGILLIQATPQAQTRMTAVVEGVVVAAGTGEPLAGARVRLEVVRSAGAASPTDAVVTGEAGLPAGEAVVSASSGIAAPIPHAVTESDGGFAFQDVPTGLYRLQVLRDGYARQSYGQRTPGGPATAFRLAAGQAVTGVTLAMIPAGNVSGIVRGLDGQPESGVPVQLLRASYNSGGRRTLQPAGAARTNDRGEYRLYWVTPGRYFISGGTPPGPARPVSSAAAASPNEIPQSYSLTFFPGVADANAAAVVEIGPGADLQGVDFTVARQRLYRVSGRIVDSATGRPPSAVSLSLAYRTLTGGSGAFNAGDRYDAATGEFELRNVPSGVYVVQAAAPEAAAIAGEGFVKVSALAARPHARVAVEVAHADVSGIHLMLSPGATLEGRLGVEGGALSSLRDWERIRVSLKPALDSAFGPDIQPASPIPASPRPDGGFSIAGVSPGEFVLGPVSGLPPGVYIREARFNGADVLAQPLRFSGSSGGVLEIVLSAGAGTVEGTAIDAESRGASGARVVLVPERRHNRTDLFRTASSDAGGRFVFRGVPPGDYRVFSWEALESFAYFDPDLLRSFESQGVPVQVSASAATPITVRTIPASP